MKFGLGLILVGGLMGAPLGLWKGNPHYFVYRGKPTVLVTSAEHYGAVINRDFDYVTYLAELKRHGLNLTRIWVGPYREIAGSFNITQNTLAPKPESFITPWQQVSLGKFDLEKWNPEFFARLRAFMKEAARQGVIVEVNLFCPYYEDSMWSVSPLNAKNNVNGVGDVPRTEALTMKHANLVKVQEALVRKLVAELSAFDNFYFEIANEPYFGGVTLEWQQHIAQVIQKGEAGKARRHLISQNIANGSRRVEKPFEEVSIFNFHYSRPAESVALNYDLNRALGCNETGFDGSADVTYRVQGWEYLMAGGALYNNLDYSFVVGHEKGDFAYPDKTPGGGSAALRAQLGTLKKFFDSMPFVRMTPAKNIIRGVNPKGATVRALAQDGAVYAIYVHHGREVKDAKPKYQVDGHEQILKMQLELPKGQYAVEWWTPSTGAVTKGAPLQHAGGMFWLESAPYKEDIAVRLTSIRGGNRKVER